MLGDRVLFIDFALAYVDIGPQGIYADLIRLNWMFVDAFGPESIDCLGQWVVNQLDPELKKMYKVRWVVYCLNHL